MRWELLTNTGRASSELRLYLRCQRAGLRLLPLCVDKTVCCLLISNLGPVSSVPRPTFVPESVLSVLAAIRVFFRSRGDTALEILALRQPGRSPQTEAAAAASKLSGSAVLDYSAAVLVSLGRSPRHRQVQDRRRLASRGLPLVLALAFPAARRSAKDHRGDSTAHPSDGTAECRLGCPKDPRRTAKARFRAVRTDRGSLPAAHSSSA
jgi:hypothetical protein